MMPQTKGSVSLSLDRTTQPIQLVFVGLPTIHISVDSARALVEQLQIAISTLEGKS